MSRVSHGRGRSRRAAAPSAPSQRSIMVWGTLLASMTLAGGLLVLLQGPPAPRAGGWSLPPLVSAAGPSSIESVFQTQAPLGTHPWKAIVIHASGSPFGTADSIEAQHRAMNLAGLGFHFLVGNGNGLDDGEIYVGRRWLDQLSGAHAAGPQGDWYNRNSIGICLVGDGHRRPFSEQQMNALAQLVAALSEKFGISDDRIVLHSDLTRVDDPGRFFPEAAFRRQLAGLR